jgi:hypothetical protein
MGRHRSIGKDACAVHQSKRLPELSVSIEAVTASVSNLFQANDDACRFGLVRSQFCKVRIAPFSKPYYLSVLSFRPRNFEQLQYVESAGVEKESMMPKQFAKLPAAG